MSPEFTEQSINRIISKKEHTPYVFARQGMHVYFEKMTKEDLTKQWDRIGEKYKFSTPYSPIDKGIFRLDKPVKSIIVGPDERERDIIERRTTVEDMNRVSKKVGISTYTWKNSPRLRRLR